VSLIAVMQASDAIHKSTDSPNGAFEHYFCDPVEIQSFFFQMTLLKRMILRTAIDFHQQHGIEMRNLS